VESLRRAPDSLRALEHFDDVSRELLG